MPALGWRLLGSALQHWHPSASCSAHKLSRFQAYAPGRTLQRLGQRCWSASSRTSHKKAESQQAMRSYVLPAAATPLALGIPSCRPAASRFSPCYKKGQLICRAAGCTCWLEMGLPGTRVLASRKLGGCPAYAAAAGAADGAWEDACACVPSCRHDNCQPGAKRVVRGTTHKDACACVPSCRQDNCQPGAKRATRGTTHKDAARAVAPACSRVSDKGLAWGLSAARAASYERVGPWLWYTQILKARSATCRSSCLMSLGAGVPGGFSSWCLPSCARWVSCAFEENSPSLWRTEPQAADLTHAAAGTTCEDGSHRVLQVGVVVPADAVRVLGRHVAPDPCGAALGDAEQPAGQRVAPISRPPLSRGACSRLRLLGGLLRRSGRLRGCRRLRLRCPADTGDDHGQGCSGRSVLVPQSNCRRACCRLIGLSGARDALHHAQAEWCLSVCAAASRGVSTFRVCLHFHCPPADSSLA